MSSPKRIEDLTEATNLHDNDLLFASVQQGSGFDSKKVTLASIAEYVQNYAGTGGSGGGGINPRSSLAFEIIDRAALATSNGSYVWNETVSANTEFEKEFDHDSVVYLKTNVTYEYSNG